MTHTPYPDSLIDAIQSGEISPDEADPDLWAESERLDDLCAAADLARKARLEGDW